MEEKRSTDYILFQVIQTYKAPSIDRTGEPFFGIVKELTFVYFALLPSSHSADAMFYLTYYLTQRVPVVHRFYLAETGIWLIPIW